MKQLLKRRSKILLTSLILIPILSKAAIITKQMKLNGVVSNVMIYTPDNIIGLLPVIMQAQKTEAESYKTMSGVQLETTSDSLGGGF